MKDLLFRRFSNLKEYWIQRTKKQKIVFVSSAIILLLFIIILTVLLTRTAMVPLYTNLSPSETGAIKEELDARGVKSEITENGTTIRVPEGNAENLMVELAAEGIPKSGNIDYSFFSENAGFGMTDNEFNVLKLDATQNELAALIKGIDGIEDANVMITMPEKSVFVKEDNEEASASIILQTKPGHDFNEKQIKSLYHLVSKSVPNLPTDNIVIRNQYLEYFDLNDGSYADSGIDQQMKIKERLERDIQRQVQQMLGTLMGHEKVITSVTADIDFTQENREENLVTPVDEENMRGIAISAQRITETFSGDEAQAGGIPQGGDPADSGASQYMEGSGNSGDYEKSEETLNYEVNKVRKEIVESPYKIRDLGIQVMVEPPDPEEPASFPEERREDITQLLSTIVRTSIDKESGTDISDAAIDDKVVVTVQPFNGNMDRGEDSSKSVLPWWGYVIGGILVAIIALLIFLWTRSRARKAEELEEMTAIAEDKPAEPPKPTIEELAAQKAAENRERLEELAKDNPEQFANLLRTWLAEEEEEI
ncbi:flagellar basal-body MS-ring/collar protein FliF [Siminovitchia fortis]|uniref:Flagellar M-ring protein n=1 Tax=Siminovitchia fortis TaxID=254758 RepID=A0A443J152_9BACI|nr:flagellar basal-body MS-ring/collar protein FliF [Siminovitchia fortis]RWR14120.1 flagellar basal body M-ring protein FliF [Siminovitchia fortis]WHY83309.1 flagellar basal-body MS-ring/collar protein FliF [Siminovitchia fortis]